MKSKVMLSAFCILVLLLGIGFSQEIYYYKNLTSPVNVTLANESTTYTFDEDYPAGVCSNIAHSVTTAYTNIPVEFYEYPIDGDEHFYISQILKSDIYFTFPNPSTTYSFKLAMDLRLPNGTDYESFNSSEYNVTYGSSTNVVRLSNITVDKTLEPNSTIKLTTWVKHWGASTRDITMRWNCANYPSDLHIRERPLTTSLDVFYSTPVKVGDTVRIKAQYLDYANSPIASANVSFDDGLSVVDGAYNSSSLTYDIYYSADSIGTHPIEVYAVADNYDPANTSISIDVYNGFYVTVELFTDMNYTYDNVTYGKQKYINDFAVVWLVNKSSCDYFGFNCRERCYLANYKNGLANITVLGTGAVYTLRLADGEVYLNDTNRADECPIVYNADHMADFGPFMIIQDTEIQKKYDPDTDDNIESVTTKKPSAARFNVALALLTSMIIGTVIGFLTMSGFGFLAGFIICFIVIYFIGIQFILWVILGILAVIAAIAIAPLIGASALYLAILVAIAVVITMIMQLVGWKLI